MSSTGSREDYVSILNEQLGGASYRDTWGSVEVWNDEKGGFVSILVEYG